MPAKINLLEMACCVQQQPFTSVAIFAVCCWRCECICSKELQIVSECVFVCVCCCQRNHHHRGCHIVSAASNWIISKLSWNLLLSFRFLYGVDPTAAKHRWKRSLSLCSCLLLMFSKIFCKNIKYNMIPFVSCLFFCSHLHFASIFFVFDLSVYRGLGLTKEIHFKMRQKMHPHTFFVLYLKNALWKTKENITLAPNSFRQLQIWPILDELDIDSQQNRHIFMRSIFVMCPLNSSRAAFCERIHSDKLLCSWTLLFDSH